MPALLATWNPARDAWETSHSHIDLFSALSAVFSETWPSWGMTRGGVAYELPTSVPLTDGSVSSSSPGLLLTPRTSRGAASTENAYLLDGRAKDGSLLPTPKTTDANGAGAHGTGGPDLRTALSLLPTPKATDGTKDGPNQRGSSGDLTLPSAAVTLLPTPSVADGMGGHLSRSGSRSLELLLPGVAKELGERLLPTASSRVDCGCSLWGQYAPAVHRWEMVLQRPAPAPTELSQKGSHRLSALAVEFMMGLPAGWVTDVPGLTRNEQLKALGNGVVSQQCAAALRLLLPDTGWQVAS